MPGGDHRASLAIFIRAAQPLVLLASDVSLTGAEVPRRTKLILGTVRLRRRSQPEKLVVVPAAAGRFVHSSRENLVDLALELEAVDPDLHRDPVAPRARLPAAGGGDPGPSRASGRLAVSLWSERRTAVSLFAIDIPESAKRVNTVGWARRRIRAPLQN